MATGSWSKFPEHCSSHFTGAAPPHNDARSTAVSAASCKQQLDACQR